MTKTKTVEVNPLYEAIKEPLRLIMLSILPFGIAYLTELSYDWAIIATIILRGLDKYFHEVGKAEGNVNLTKGITRF